MNKYLKRAFPVLIGGLLGFAYYYYIGCNSGNCPITSNPYVSTVYGAFLGFVIGFPSKKKNEKPTDQ